MKREHVQFNDPLDCVRQIRRWRQWEDANLPVYATQLGRDFMLLLAQLRLEGRAFSLKEIYLSLPYSENGIRQHLQKLERAGWLQLSSPEGDKRFKSIIPHMKLDQALTKYVEMLMNPR